jgi:hypothetical protein
VCTVCVFVRRTYSAHQELTTKALHILRKLVEMENKKEDDKASVLDWETVGDDPEVPTCPDYDF